VSTVVEDDSFDGAQGCTPLLYVVQNSSEVGAKEEGILMIEGIL